MGESTTKVAEHTLLAFLLPWGRLRLWGALAYVSFASGVLWSMDKDADAVITWSALGIAVVSGATTYWSDELKGLRLLSFSFVMAFTIAMTLATSRNSADSASKMNTSLDALAKINDATKAIQRTSREISAQQADIATMNRGTLELQARLLDSTDAITRLSKEGLNNVTGGDSFPYVIPRVNFPQDGKLPIVIVNHGKYPLTGLTVEVRSFSMLLFAGDKDPGVIGTKTQPADLPPSGLAEIAILLDPEKFPVPTEDVGWSSFPTYVILISCQRGVFHESLFLEPVGPALGLGSRAKWKYRMNVKRTSTTPIDIVWPVQVHGVSPGPEKPSVFVTGWSQRESGLAAELKRSKRPSR